MATALGTHNIFGTLKSLITGTLASLLLSLACAQEAPQNRVWTNLDGRKLEGRMSDLGDAEVEVRLMNGKAVRIPLASLSAADQAYVNGWQDLGFGIKVGRWPQELRPMLNFTARELERKPEGECVYATPNFRYICDAPLAASLIKEYALAFEGTYYAIKNLPLQLDPRPPGNGHFVVRLFRNREDYLRAGGPEGSSGVYVVRTREILVPMDSLGVRTVGRRVAIDPRAYDAGTLIHEITHQVMHDWLNVLPVWFVEGIAEYMAAVPFDDARFDFRRMEEGLGGYLETAYHVARRKEGSLPLDMVAPEALMAMTHQQWASALSEPGAAALNYRSALLLVYYLIHLDGKGDGSSIVAYLRQAWTKQGEMEHFVREYNEAVNRYNASLAAYNDSVRRYNQELVDFRESVESYNNKVRIFNGQLRRGVAEQDLIEVGDEPGLAPEPPLKPELPRILAERPDGGGVVDLSRAELEARRAIYRSRNPSQLWSDMERAFAAQGLKLRPVQAEAARSGTRAIPLSPPKKAP
ncbi:MAG: hypothetical protein KGS60_03740 [Verrucomicrobia bacterium]|nr:hypothetical protein [Verrucomicrobiota bacterium]